VFVGTPFFLDETLISERIICRGLGGLIILKLLTLFTIRASIYYNEGTLYLFD
jgi:hypothetical protein